MIHITLKQHTRVTTHSTESLKQPQFDCVSLQAVCSIRSHFLLTEYTK